MSSIKVLYKLSLIDTQYPAVREVIIICVLPHRLSRENPLLFVMF